MNKVVTTKILITEDNPALRTALFNKFKKAGFMTFQAEDGEAGLTVATREHPDVILLDVLMPKMDGLTMLRKIRGEGDWGKNVPIFILTNLSPGTEDIAKVLASDSLVQCMVKADWKIADVVKKVQEKIARP